MNARAFVVHLSHFCRSAYSGLGWTLLYLGLIGSPMRSAESPQRDYDLPVGDAANTLRLFVEQSGEQVLYLVNSVRTVKTNAVRGRYTALEAINRMLDRTPLIVVQDVRTGALMVKRSSQEVDTPNPDHLYPPANDSPKEPSKTMKRKNPFALLGAWIALALAPSPAAQAADNPPAGAHRETGTGTITGRVQNVATKQYLNNARVSIEGTQLVTFTDSFGTYRLVGAPSGPVVLEVFYTGLDTSRTTVNVPANGTVEQSVELFSVARYGQSPDTVNLDPFLVSSNRETNAEAIAINEQRFAPNIKNVMSTESLGNVVGNSVGEFLKFIPGLTAEYGGEPIFEVSVRGIGGGMTSFTADGAPMVSVNMWLTAGRTFNIDSLSLNDISRIEVTKVPTPSSPADSLAGSVNVISKSAFERDSAQLKVGVSLVGNSENLHLRRIPYSYTDKKTLATRPSFDFDYTLPIGKKFGIVLTGMRNDRFHEQHLSNMVYATSGTGTGASFSRPYLQQYNLYDGPKTITRETLSLKADWRVSEHGTLSIKGQWNRFETNIGTLIWNPTAGAVGTPTIEGGIPLSYGPDFTLGATGRGDSNFINSSESNNGGARLFGLTYKFNDGTWKAEAGVSYSKSDWLRDNFSGGHFNSIRMALRTPARVEFRDNTADHPGSIKAFGNDNQEIDLYNIDNYRVGSSLIIVGSRGKW